MTTSQIIKELNCLPSFLYIYWNPSDEKDHMVILGDQSCQQKTDHTNIILATHYNYDMQEIYEKETLEDSDKYALVKAMRHIQNLYDYRDPELYTLTKQKKCLNELISEQLDEFSKQIEMHKFSCNLCKDYH